jgi:C-terminal AAA-associated domain
MAGTFPSRDVWRRPKLRPVDLRRGFTAEEARRQLDTAIEWGRYGELSEYDSESGQLILGSDPARVGV